MTEINALHPYLSSQLMEGQVSHAYIFIGPGAPAQADALAAALECTARLPEGSACGACPACRNFRADAHPDVFRLAPEGASHRVEAIREMVASAGLSRLAGAYKVYILSQAEKMTLAAANTLLKLLEEPVAGTVLLLLTQHPDRLLPTVLSRCQLFAFAASEEPEEPEYASGLLEEAAKLLQELPDMQLYQVLLAAREHDKDREDQRQFFYALLLQVHAAICGHLELPMTMPALLNSAALLEKAVETAASGVNQKLLADSVYLHLRQNCAG